MVTLSSHGIVNIRVNVELIGNRSGSVWPPTEPGYIPAFWPPPLADHE